MTPLTPQRLRVCLPLFFSFLPVLHAQSAASAGAAQQHEQKAQEYLREKKPELAIPEFSAVVAADPTNLNAQANLGVLLYFQGKYAEAEPHLRTALAQQPGLTQIQTLLGMCEHRLGEQQAATSDLEAAFPRLADPKVQREAGLMLIELYTASQQLEKAAAILPALRKASPTDPELLYAAYRVYTDLAGEAMLDLSVSAPASAQMHQAIAHELVKERDLPGAIANYRDALKIDANVPGLHFELAEALHNSTDLALRAEAPAEYKAALAANPRDAESMARLGDIDADSSNTEQAASEYKEALAMDPASADATVGLARTLIETEKPAAAVPLLQKVLAADPSNMQAHYRLSAAYRKLGRTEEARHETAEYQRLKELKEKLSAVYKQMRMDAPGGSGGGDSNASPR